MIADDLQQLYMLLRGSRSAIQVLDAKALVQESNFVAAHEKLIDSRESYMESRSRLMKQDAAAMYTGKSKEDDRNRRTLLRKQEKTKEILKAFEELMPAIEKMSKRQQQTAAADAEAARVQAIDETEPEFDAGLPKDAPENEAGIEMLATPADVSESFVRAYQGAIGEEKLDVINEVFGFREVTSDDDIYPNAVYFIRTSQQMFLVRSPAILDDGEPIRLTSLADRQNLQPFSRSDFLKLGTRRKMVLLTKRLLLDGSDLEAGSNADVVPKGDANDSADESTTPDGGLDMGTFSQLLMAAQRSGICSGADQIGHVRDREFRLQKYDLAFQSINALYSQFSAAANSRTQALTREDADIASGRIKISPKDLQAKRTRDRMQSQEVERAGRRFQVVLEGLRVLAAVNSNADAT